MRKHAAGPWDMPVILSQTKFPHQEGWTPTIQWDEVSKEYPDCFRESHHTIVGDDGRFRVTYNTSAHIKAIAKMKLQDRWTLTDYDHETFSESFPSKQLALRMAEILKCPPPHFSSKEAHDLDVDRRHRISLWYPEDRERTACCCILCLD